jgi:hypothetical protein
MNNFTDGLMLGFSSDVGISFFDRHLVYLVSNDRIPGNQLIQN